MSWSECDPENYDEFDPDYSYKFETLVDGFPLNNNIKSTNQVIDSQLNEINQSGIESKIGIEKISDFYWRFFLFYGAKEERMRTGFIEFDDKFPIEPPII